jgi:hypothetical protein
VIGEQRRRKPQVPRQLTNSRSGLRVRLAEDPSLIRLLVSDVVPFLVTFVVDLTVFYDVCKYYEGISQRKVREQ